MEHFHYKIPGWFTYPALYSYMVQRYDNAHFVEIGSYQGCSAAFMAVEIINSGHNINFDCIDIWDRFSINGLNTKDPGSLPEDIVYKMFLENIKPVENYIKPIRTTSLQAAALYEDNSLEFVFIDADHEYEAVKDDIRAWFPKVKVGGHIAGHDYSDTFPGVVKAVNEFFEGYIKNGGNVNCGEGCWCVFKSNEKQITDEEFIYKELYEWNVYHVFSDDIKDKTIVDIGAHVGMFDIFCLQYQPKQIIAVEPNPDNYLKLVKNTSEHIQIKTINKACDYITGKTLTINNKGASSQTGQGDIPVSTISLEDIVKIAGSNLIVKIDIEGAEHDIIKNTPKSVFNHIDTILFEMHELTGSDGNDINNTTNILLDLGFNEIWTEYPYGSVPQFSNSIVRKFKRQHVFKQ